MIKRIASFFGSGARAFVALVGITGVSLGIANYTVTQGTGTDFGSRVNGGIHYAQQLLCDMNIASVSGNCAAVGSAATFTSTTTAIAVGVTNTLTAISMGDGITTGNFPSGSPVFSGLFNGTTYDRQRSAGPTGFAGVTATPISLANGYALVKGTTAAMTGTAITTMISAVASQRIYITRIKCNNTSATATLVQIQDGSGGTVLDTLAAGATYGGEQGTGPSPILWTTSGNGLYAQNVTTGASVICTASGYAG